MSEAAPQHDPYRDKHDSAGIPFHGREVTSTGFDNDTGEADTILMTLLEADDEHAWMARLAETRLLVPIVAAPTEIDNSGELSVEKSTDMAVVTLLAPDGTKALPVFTGLAALAEWDPQARPSPVQASFAAQAAIADHCDVLLLDMASEHRVVVRSSMVWALARKQEWVPAHDDPFVRKAVERVLRDEPDTRSVALEDAGEGVLRLRIALVPGLDQTQLQELAQRVGERFAIDGETRARLEGLTFAFEVA